MMDEKHEIPEDAVLTFFGWAKGVVLYAHPYHLIDCPARFRHPPNDCCQQHQLNKELGQPEGFGIR